MVGASASPENMPCASVSPDAGLVPVCVQHESLEPMEVRPDVSLAYESFALAPERRLHLGGLEKPMPSARGQGYDRECRRV